MRRQGAMQLDMLRKHLEIAVECSEEREEARLKENVLRGKENTCAYTHNAFPLFSALLVRKKNLETDATMF